VKRTRSRHLCCIRFAGIWRRYAAERKRVEDFREKNLARPVTIPIEELNAHHHLLERVVVDTESFFWFANRLLTNVALTLNYFFKKAQNFKSEG
jgi:hypothetical protein